MNIIAKIWTGAQTVWNTVEADIDKAAALVKSVLPASAYNIAVSDLKQMASDAIGSVDSGLTSFAPTLVQGAEKLLDDALVSYTNGLALPLVPGTNKLVDDVSSALIASIHAWNLKAKAGLAANNVLPVVAAPLPAPPQAVLKPAGA